MKKIYKNIIINLFVIVSFASPLILSAGEAEIKAAHEFLDAVKFEESFETVTNVFCEEHIKIMKSRNPDMGEHLEEKFREMRRKHTNKILMPLREFAVKMYSELFTAQEIKEMTAFERSKAGQKLREKLPEIMQRTMQFTQEQCTHMMSDMLKEIETAK